MKKTLILFLIIILAGIITKYAYDYYFDENKTCSKESNTEVVLINNTNDTIITYLTLNSDTNYVNNVNNVFGILGTGLQGYLMLMPNDTLSYTSPCCKGFSGNLSFGTPPLNCADTLFPFGVNIFEFTLNDNFKSVKSPQETIDISCVAGVNCSIACKVSDNNWNAGSIDTVKSFQNSYIYDNTGRAGIYPYGCDICTASQNPPVCSNARKYAQPQSNAICNVQRDANKKGGKVYVIFNGFINGEINNQKQINTNQNGK